MSFLKSRWSPNIEEFIYPLKEFRFNRVDFQNIIKGIDNVHIDIELSEKLTKTIFNFILHATRRDISIHLWREEKHSHLDWDQEQFSNTYQDFIETMIHRVHSDGEKYKLELIYLAIYRLIFISFDMAISHIRSNLKDDIPLHGGKALAQHQRSVLLAKGENAVRYRVISMVLKQIAHHETGSLQKIRQSLLHEPWIFNPEILFNPLLSIGNIQNNSMIYHHYALAFSYPKHFKTIGTIFYNLFRGWLPHRSVPVSSIKKSQQKSRLDQGTIDAYLQTEVYLDYLIQEKEYRSTKTSWIDYPENVEMILGGTDHEQINTGPWEEPEWPNFQKRLLADLNTALSRHHLLQPAWASYKAIEIYKNIHQNIPFSLVYEYLSGFLDKKTFSRNISNIQEIHQAEISIQQIDNTLKEFKALSKTQIRILSVSFLSNFLSFRRDLKLAWQFYQQIDQIKILTEEKEIELSLANHHLYQFKFNEEITENSIKSHCVLKADLRGSTGITKLMREKNLNPASYFSKNFFNPINKLIPIYGAEKVFIEGDAIILANYNHKEIGSGLAIARSCGLAIEIIKIVRRKASENKRHELPDLELGIGVVFEDEEPTFLDDDGHKIMISPAINWADRLSGCHSDLKNKKLGISENGQGVYIAYHEEQFKRYNVNGIILDNNAFKRLHKEIQLRGFSLLGQKSTKKSSYFYIGQYPDTQNKLRWLFIRRGIIEGNIPDNLEKVYYEVITDPDVISKVKNALTKRHKEATT